jgi:hypothetical protein
MSKAKKTYKFIRFLSGSEWRGDARLYKVTPAIRVPQDKTLGTKAFKTGYLIVSAVAMFYSGPETYIFPASEDGEVLDWGELDGSFRGGLDHTRALAAAGYAPAEEAKPPKKRRQNEVRNHR